MVNPKTGIVGVTKKAIILSRHKRGQASFFSLVTDEGLVRQGVLPNRRLASMKGSGYLQPFSEVYITLGAQEKFGKEIRYVQPIQQVDGISVVPRILDSLQNIAYTAIAGELVHLLFSMAEKEGNLYHILQGYVRAISSKSIRLATILLGWQLLQLGGFVPEVEYLQESSLKTKDFSGRAESRSAFWKEVHYSTGRMVPISNAFQSGLPLILSYTWEEEPISFSESVWNEAEEILFAFCESHTGERLKSRSFLLTI